VVQVYLCGWAFAGLLIAIAYSFLDTVSGHLSSQVCAFLPHS
jgi:hypothetical protein